MDYTIAELPSSERPREKLEKKGVSALSDVELLSLILRTGTSGKNVKELSGEILKSFDLEKLSGKPMKQLQSFEGVSKVKAGQLKAVSELGRRMQRTERKKLERLSDVKEMVEDMKLLDEERLRIFLLNSGNELMGEEELKGGVNRVNFQPREVLREAVRRDATAIILAHNHPSGKAEATEEDLEVTRELKEVGESLGVKLLDHVIVGEETFSMRRSADLNF